MDYTYQEITILSIPCILFSFRPTILQPVTENAQERAERVRREIIAHTGTEPGDKMIVWDYQPIPNDPASVRALLVEGSRYFEFHIDGMKVPAVDVLVDSLLAAAFAKWGQLNEKDILIHLGKAIQREVEDHLKVLTIVAPAPSQVLLDSVPTSHS